MVFLTVMIQDFPSYSDTYVTVYVCVKLTQPMIIDRSIEIISSYVSSVDYFQQGKTWKKHAVQPSGLNV